MPPFIVWAIGLHIMPINPAVLMGAVAGSRSHSGPAREAAKEIDSSVPWSGFPVGYAVSGILLTIFGYVAMAPAWRYNPAGCAPGRKSCNNNHPHSGLSD